MPEDHFSRVYANQEYLTPGNPQTVDRIVEAIAPSGAPRTPRVLEVASGKGEAACAVAERAGCDVYALDRHPPFLRLAAAKISVRGLGGRVRLVRGDGRRLPFPDASFDAGYCMGAPSLVGLEPCLRELHRVVRANGPVVVSDVYWHTLPSEPLGPEWLWLAEDARQPTLDGYREVMANCGLRVEATQIHDLAAWDAYQAPMLATAAAERSRGEDAFATEIERGVAMERRAVDRFIGYVTFVARSTAAN
jgi:ubiquinone/menaquinone biosynthesis C-methylase UbiE